MLPSDLWRQTDPRLLFPVFREGKNFIDLMIQPFPGPSVRKAAAPLYHLAKGRKKLFPTLHDYYAMLRAGPFRFRGALLSREGRLVDRDDFPGEYRVGDFFFVDVNEWMSRRGIPARDGGFVLIANRGRHDVWNSSPGSATCRVVTSKAVIGYRTGLFTRLLNAGKKHSGFTGINPHILLNDRFETGLLLINHSSRPDYDRSVSPTVRLHRSPTEFLEAPFGDIPAHGMLEKSLRALFPGAGEFLSPTGGLGCTIARAKGSTLASLHVVRDRSGGLLGLEHSRPYYPNLVDYL